MFSRIFKPRPYPSFALISIILIILGTITLSRADESDIPALRRVVTIIGAAMFACSFVTLVSFIRGLRADLSLGREGIMAMAKITNIEHRRVRSRSGGPLTDRWYIRFQFIDMTGTTYEEEAEFFDEEEIRKYKVGGSANIRYHPKHPNIFRWLD
jgi:hypothetical protein